VAKTFIPTSKIAAAQTIRITSTFAYIMEIPVASKRVVYVCSAPM